MMHIVVIMVMGDGASDGPCGKKGDGHRFSVSPEQSPFFVPRVTVAQGPWDKKRGDVITGLVGLVL
jgi:hypothetical protein